MDRLGCSVQSVFLCPKEVGCRWIGSGCCHRSMIGPCILVLVAPTPQPRERHLWAGVIWTKKVTELGCRKCGSRCHFQAILEIKGTSKTKDPSVVQHPDPFIGVGFGGELVNGACIRHGPRHMTACFKLTSGSESMQINARLKQ